MDIYVCEKILKADIKKISDRDELPSEESLIQITDFDYGYA